MKLKNISLQEKSTEAFPITRMNWFFNSFKMNKMNLRDMFNFSQNECVSVNEIYMRFLECLGLINGDLDENIGMALLVATYNIYFMSNWNLYKQIYRFDGDFFGYIACSDYNSSKVNVVNYLCKLPCDYFFIDNKFTDSEGNLYRGCFVCVERDTKLLRLFFIENNMESDLKWANIPLNYGNGTVKDLMSFRINEEKKTHKEKALSSIDDNIVLMADRICKCLDYLCADNKQVEYRKAKDKKEEYNLNRQREKGKVLLNDVGVRIGNTIRQNRIVYEKSEDCEHHTGSPKSPHLRSAHYHSFWTGKKDGSEERKLIVKFIEPIFIGSCNNIPTIHKVKR